jgi:diguanylate cyclase (GGDEF)-like protein
MNISPSALLAIVVATTIANILILVMVSLRSKNSRSRRLAAVETMLSTSYFEGGSSQPRPVPPSNEQDPNGDPPELETEALGDGSNGIEPTGSAPYKEAWVTMEREAFGVESGAESAETEAADDEANDQAIDAEAPEASDADSPVAVEEAIATEEPVMSEESVAANEPDATMPVMTEATEEPSATEEPVMADEPGGIEEHVVRHQFVWTFEEPAMTEEIAMAEEPVASEEAVAEPATAQEPVITEEPVTADEPVDGAAATASIVGRDALTGLLDALSFREILAHEDARGVRYGRPATVVVFELDGLSKIVDRLGPNTGDRIEVALTDTIARLARRADYVARLEPGRYGALMPETDEIAAINYVERIRRACDLWLESGAIAMRLAIGWASSGGDVQPAAAMRTATDRMHLELRQNVRMVGNADAATDVAVPDAVGVGGSDLAVNGL